MAKLARNHLKEEKTVEVANAVRVAPGLVAISYIENDERYDDLYNGDDGEIDAIIEDQAGKPKKVTLVPDSSADIDNHPEVKMVADVENTSA